MEGVDENMCSQPAVVNNSMLYLTYRYFVRLTFLTLNFDHFREGQKYGNGKYYDSDADLVELHSDFLGSEISELKVESSILLAPAPKL